MGLLATPLVHGPDALSVPAHVSVATDIFPSLRGQMELADGLIRFCHGLSGRLGAPLPLERRPRKLRAIVEGQGPEGLRPALRPGARL